MTSLRRLADLPFVPAISPQALGAFRIALAAGLILVVELTTVSVVPSPEQRHYAAIDWPFIHRLAVSPDAIRALQLGAVAAALLFAIGLFTRWVYAVFVAAFFVITLIVLERRGAHDLGLPLVTLIGWLTVPWGAGISVDEWWRMRRHSSRVEQPPGKAYGFAIWWPALTLGLALFAAAYTKLTSSGLSWITGGTVKYHFVTDSAAALVDWGLWVASHPAIAVLLSFGAIALEAGFILVIFAKRPGVRLLGLVAGALLFLSLNLFQGVFWIAWLVLLLAFLPWGWLDRPVAARETIAPLRPAQVFVIVAVVALQVYATARRVEREPLISNFPMYSNTWASTAQYDRDMEWRFTRVLRADSDDGDVSSVLARLRDDDRIALVRLAERFAAGTESPGEAQKERIERLCEAFVREGATLPEHITLTIERGGFDWERGTFVPYRPIPTAAIPLASLCPSHGTQFRQSR